MPMIWRAGAPARAGGAGGLMAPPPPPPPAGGWGLAPTPPPLPRPPAWIWALTTTGTPSSWAIWRASWGVAATRHLGTGTPNSDMICLAWYSWIFMTLLDGSRVTGQGSWVMGHGS